MSEGEPRRTATKKIQNELWWVGNGVRCCSGLARRVSLHSSLESELEFDVMVTHCFLVFTPSRVLSLGH